MPFYRYGPPGGDIWVHLRFGAKSRVPQNCVSPAFPEDNHKTGHLCARSAVALCDAPGCDKPICELHRTMHKSKDNTDFCPDHEGMKDA